MRQVHFKEKETLRRLLFFIEITVEIDITVFMKAKILRWSHSRKFVDDPNFIGYVDVEIPGRLKLLGIKVFRAGHTAIGLSLKPPYVGGRPCYSLEGDLYNNVLESIKENLS
jgi:hypothetical protein